jgi:hypothetical protein
MDDEQIRIIEINEELNKLANSNVLQHRTAVACGQAASLLERMREVLVRTWGSRPQLTADEAVKQLNWILTEQGEG